MLAFILNPEIQKIGSAFALSFSNGANFDSQILKGRGGKAKFFCILQFLYCI
jgi:hypothetical protein